MVFEDDPIFFELLHHFDLSKLMWANDFPHGDSTWPHSKEHIDKILNILRGKNQEEIKNLLFYDNVAKLYDINISN
jgi:predicted TIM-barrel fold metal-dependent hydrolase